MILVGDVREKLAELEDGSVRCCVTSPPYWGLRDYGHDGQLGLEETPEEYVDNMVAVFREVRRVLTDDGTLWLNLGDSYAANRGGSHQPAETLAGGVGGKTEDGERVNRSRKDGYNPSRNAHAIGLKHKDLVGIPWRVALALQADGWWLRSDIIWAKPNPMPESVTDRPTKAHEYIFLLSKSERYFYDADAIAEDSIHAGRVVEYDGTQKNATVDPELLRTRLGGPNGSQSVTVGATRNRRSVWTVTTKPFPKAHFAVFPLTLPMLCIQAGTSAKGGCVECGAPMERMVEKDGVLVPASQRHAYDENGKPVAGDNRFDHANRASFNSGGRTVEKVPAGWQPTCDCNAGTKPDTVLDPFCGAGTTGVAATKLAREFIGIELNPEYAEMAERRINGTPLSLELGA